MLNILTIKLQYTELFLIEFLLYVIISFHEKNQKSKIKWLKKVYIFFNDMN